MRAKVRESSIDQGRCAEEACLRGEPSIPLRVQLNSETKFRQHGVVSRVALARWFQRARLLARFATFAPCLPNAVRVLRLRWAMVFLDFAAAAAFLIFFRAAARCFAELIGPPGECLDLLSIKRAASGTGPFGLASVGQGCQPQGWVAWVRRKSQRRFSTIWQAMGANSS
jgi:hypothetical protein